eukprot:SAG22_NODE_1183_length_5231_cov_6.467069_6_plen_61_part_00
MLYSMLLFRPGLELLYPWKDFGTYGRSRSRRDHVVIVVWVMIDKCATMYMYMYDFSLLSE